MVHEDEITKNGRMKNLFLRERECHRNGAILIKSVYYLTRKERTFYRIMFLEHIVTYSLEFDANINDFIYITARILTDNVS